ncbi:hypothetical protein [Peribacillus frigoritolerans]|uniref:hypothetical protein n=1 Tax=Peribacillus frigoritolerans TaxID=450367 RepID=UPI002ECEAB1C|nr:hypothetical protein [Peribacillus frigoritolerans]
MKSIQSRLLIMLLIFIVLPYFLSVFFIYTYTKNSVEQYELENSREQLQKNADELEQYFDDMIDFPYIFCTATLICYGFLKMASKTPFISTL